MSDVALVLRRTLKALRLAPPLNPRLPFPNPLTPLPELEAAAQGDVAALEGAVAVLDEITPHPWQHCFFLWASGAEWVLENGREVIVERFNRKKEDVLSLLQKALTRAGRAVETAQEKARAGGAE